MRRNAKRVPGPPTWIAPQLAILTASAPEGSDWLHEIKYDGYRLLARVTSASTQLLTRNQKDWTARFRGVAEALSELDAGPLLVDGEVAVELANGVTSFQALQNAERDGSRGRLYFFAFDLLYADGQDLTGLPLLERKARLEAVLATSSSAVIRYSDHVVDSGVAFFEQACRHGLEGIISKKTGAPYRSGRGSDWLKVKCVREQEFVIGGFTDPSGSRQGLGALHVGAYDEAGRLVYRGKVGTGFSDAVLRELRRRLNRLKRASSPFDAGPRTGLRGSHWIEPQLVAQIRFTEWTDDGRLRHPSFEGLREDKDPREVRVESASPSAQSGRVLRRNPSAVPAPQTKSRAAAPPPARRGAWRRGEEEMQIAGVRLTSPSRVVYPAEGITKLDLANYYQRVGERMMPFIRGRPLTLIRCPDNIEECFFQKHIDDSSIYDELVRVPVREEKGVRYYPAVESVSGLLTLVQLGVVEFHTLGSRRDQVEKPDRITLDLDPDPDVSWVRVVQSARAIRALLGELRLRSFVKTTGGKGLHVVVPIQRRSSWEEVKAFSHAVAKVLHDAAPGEYTLRVAKARRKNRILLDYLRNARGSVAVEAYSARARPGAPIALPVAWEELSRVGPGRFTIRSVARRLAAHDPWRDYFDVRQAITAEARRKVGL